MGYFVLQGYMSSTQKVVAFTAVSVLCPWGQPLEERIECAYCYNCCISKERKLLVAAVPARREDVLYQVTLWCCCSCCTSQEGINMPALPMALPFFFHLPCLHLVYLGFSEQCRL